MRQAFLSLADLEAYQGHRRPQRSGERLRYFCPIHGSDNQASLSVDPNTGAYHCFACGAHGYIEEHKREWLEEKQRTWTPSEGQGNKNGATSGHGAQTNARRNNRVKATGPAKSTQNPVLKYPGTFNEPKARPNPGSSPGQALASFLRELQAALPGSRGEEYLRQRGICLELAQAFGLGYAAPGRWPHRGRDWKWGRLVFPHTHPAGEAVNMYGRAVGSNESVPKEKRHDHLPRPKGIFNAQALQVADTVFICEGVFDALSLMAAGVIEESWAGVRLKKGGRLPRGQTEGERECSLRVQSLNHSSERTQGLCPISSCIAETTRLITIARSKPLWKGPSLEPLRNCGRWNSISTRPQPK